MMDIVTHIGCKAAIPALDAIAPVINGTMAEPAAPTPPIQPIESVSSR